MRSSAPCSTVRLPLDFTRSTSCSGTGSITSISPDSSAATRVASLPIGVNTTSLKLRTSTVRVLGWRSFRRYGPVPLALKLAVFSTPLRRSTGFSALFSSHHLWLMMASVVSVSGRMGNGAPVSISTVEASTLRTALIGAVTPFMSEPSPAARLKENTTSSASKDVPSWNLTPLRNSKRHTVGEVCDHLVASRGFNAMSLPRPTKAS